MILLAIECMTLLATLILAIITAWYAYSTAKMAREMKQQIEVGREQALLMSKSAQIIAWAALTNAASDPSGMNPFQHLRQLVRELEELEAASKGASRVE